MFKQTSATNLILIHHLKWQCNNNKKPKQTKKKQKKSRQQMAKKQKHLMLSFNLVLSLGILVSVVNCDELKELNSGIQVQAQNLSQLQPGLEDSWKFVAVPPIARLRGTKGDFGGSLGRGRWGTPSIPANSGDKIYQNQWGRNADRLATAHQAVTQGPPSQEEKATNRQSIRQQKTNKNQRRRLTGYTSGNTIIINNYYPQQSFQLTTPTSQLSSFSSSSSSSISISQSAASTQTQSYIAYNQYLKSSFPSLTSSKSQVQTPTSLPFPTANTIIINPDGIISNVFSTVIDDLKNKLPGAQIANTAAPGGSSNPTAIANEGIIKTNENFTRTSNSTASGNGLLNLGSKAQPNTTNPSSKTNLNLPQSPIIKISFKNYLTGLNPFLFAKASPETYSYSQKIFLQNVDYINKFNQQQNRTYTMGLNQFTHLSQKQFMDRYLRNIQPQIFINSEPTTNKTTISILPNIEIDWSCKASMVIDQGRCITTHILSVFEAVQITQKIYKIPTAELSIQEILSCGTDVNLKDCDGGYYSAVYDYLVLFGVGLNRAYPYEDKARLNRTVSDCATSVVNTNQYSRNKLFLKSAVRIQTGDCAEVVKQLQTRALSVTIASKDLRFYKEGIYTSSSTANHKVTLVGFNPQSRFLIKNFWGAEWGIQGYAYVSELTGICTNAMYPILQKQPKPTPCQQ